MPTFYSYFIAFVITLAAMVLLRPIALRLGLFDTPGGRKSHEGNIPLIGGIAMFLGFAFALLTVNFSLNPYRCLIAGTALLAVTGILDDFHELSPRSRLFIQLFVGILMVWWGKNELFSFGNLFYLGNIHLDYLAIPITVFAVLAVINAVNMTDGVDGLAGSICLVEFFYLSWVCHHANFMFDKQMIDLVLCVLLAFLCFNFPFKERASVFMGDSGSMMLGFLLVWFCVYLSQVPHAAARPVTFLWIMAVPLWDISNVVVKRIIRGFSPFKADRGHFHHQLLERGFSSLQVTCLISGVSFLMGLIGVVGEKCFVPESLMFAGFVACFLLYSVVLNKLLR